MSNQHMGLSYFPAQAIMGVSMGFIRPALYLFLSQDGVWGGSKRRRYTVWGGTFKKRRRTFPKSDTLINLRMKQKSSSGGEGGGCKQTSENSKFGFFGQNKGFVDVQ
jgi:hypothetical protein